MQYFNPDKSNTFIASETGIFLQYIIEKIGVYLTCQYIMQTESHLETNRNETSFQIFLELLSKNGLIKKQEMLEYLNTEKIRDYFRKKRGTLQEIKDQSYTFNPFKNNSLDKSPFYSSKSYYFLICL